VLLFHVSLRFVTILVQFLHTLYEYMLDHLLLYNLGLKSKFFLNLNLSYLFKAFTLIIVKIFVIHDWKQQM